MGLVIDIITCKRKTFHVVVVVIVSSNIQLQLESLREPKLSFHIAMAT
jgi:hypothetical protein